MKRKERFSTTQIIAIGFIVMIAVGTLLLTMPFSSADGTFTPVIDALFTATTASCVTGLVTVNTLTHWSLFGHIVILILIQFGGLGVVTFTTLFLIFIGQRISLKQRMVIQDAYNLDTLKGLVRLTKRIVIGTFCVEGVGALLYMIRFIPEYGPASGIWRSVFTSVSAFCNAGIDILGADGLAPYRGDVIVNLTTILLIVLGGLGFFVWWDVIGVIGAKKKEKSKAGIFKKLSLQSKLVFTVTGILIAAGAVFILAADWSNPESLGNLPVHEKVLGALFQSVTLRTAGFQTIPQENFTGATQILSMFLMFIGGSPGGTAGGVKTVTVAMVILSVWANLKGDKDTECFHRRISDSMVRKGVTVITVSFLVMAVSIIALSLAMPGAKIMEVIYESVSAIATVGLSRSFTPLLSFAGKVIIICTMYLGRVGPITMALAFNAKSKSKKAGRQLPEEKIMVG